MSAKSSLLKQLKLLVRGYCIILYTRPNLSIHNLQQTFLICNPFQDLSDLLLEPNSMVLTIGEATKAGTKKQVPHTI